MRMSNSLDLDQARQFVGPDLGLNCLKRLLADNTGRQKIKKNFITMQTSFSWFKINKTK